MLRWNRWATGCGASMQRALGNRRLFSNGNVFSGRSRARLERLEDEANMRVHDAMAQVRFLKEVRQVSPEIVIQRVESGRFATNEAVIKEYLKALVATGKVDQTSLNQVLPAMQQQHQQPMQGGYNSYGMNYQHNQAPVQQMYGGSNGTGGGNGGYNFYGNGGFGGGNYYGGGAAAGAAGSMFGGGGSAMGAGGAYPGAFSSETHPLFVQVVDGGIKSKMWMTLRMLGVGFLILAGVNMFMMDGKGMPRGLGLSNEVKPVMEETGKTFDDVKGCSEAKSELMEIVEYLRDPGKFTRLGGKLPKGVLLTGPPGTGKTLLAKSIAGESGCPFFYASGSEFEELYVGVGARRVRDLFDAAKKASPCIVFIDEIDAIGSTRALKEQQALKMTLNQLLVELDGFKESEGVIIIGATNFPELLDAALVRPGRFDRNVVVPLPDLKDRKEILELYLSKVPIADDVNVEIIARGTPGLSGADLSNLVNMAALNASTSNADFVSLADLEYAKDKILMGAERKSALIPEEVREVTAYHEGGHALVALHTKGSMPIHKATIIPRGQALGLVSQLPEEKDTMQRSKHQMLAEIDVCFGGRIAEELIYGPEHVTSGASSDLQKATQIARHMVERYGMGSDDSVGLMFIPDSGSRDRQAVSDETKQKIDMEVKKLLNASYERTKALLNKHKRELHRLAKALLENETLTSEQIQLVIKGKPLPKPEPPKESSSNNKIKNK